MAAPVLASPQPRTRTEVSRREVEELQGNSLHLLRSVRVVPEQKDGRVVGLKLFGIQPTSLLGTLGLQNGDRLETINNFNMGSPEKALEAYATLRTASRLELKVNRRGASTGITYTIK